MTSFQASLLRAMIPLVLVSAGAVYALDAWREYRTKEELSQRLVRRGADFVAQRFDHILSEAALGARVLATGGPSGDLPKLVERIAATPVNTPPGPDALAAVALANSRIVPYLRTRPNTSAAQIASEAGLGFLVLQLGPERFRNRIVNTSAWGTRALWVELDPLGRPLRTAWADTDHDPRTRPWFALAGVPANQVRWVEPGPMSATADLGMTASAWWTWEAVRWVGALDVLLLDITRFTQDGSTLLTPETLAAAFTADWHVIGLPRTERFATPEQQRAAFLSPADRIGRPAVVEALRSVEPIALSEVKAVPIDAEGRAWWAGVAKYPIPGTRGFLIMVAVPDGDLLQGVADIRAALLAATIAVLALALAISMWLARSFARPLEALSAQSRRLEAFEFGEVPAPATNVREIHDLAQAQQRALRAVESFSRYVPMGVVQELVRRGEVARIGGGSRVLTALFTDVAGFTAIAERLGPGVSALHLSGYFEALIDAIEARQGTVDKFMGDGLFAFWGAPSDVPGAPRLAVEAVLAIRSRLGELEPQWGARGLPPLPTRFGLATGPAIVGNMGAPRRLAYTAIGDPINLASRLEGVNKAYGTWVVADAGVRLEAGDGYVWRRLDRVRVFGRNEPVFVHELIGRVGEVEGATLDLVAEYEAAWEQYAARNFERATRAFAGLARRHPGDRAVALMLDVCERLAAAGAREDWAPITSLTEK